MQRIRTLLLAAAACLAFSMPGLPQAPDNSGANKQNTQTAEDQGTSPADRELAAKIRKSVTDDKALSTYAHNVKIIVNNGAVTLRGPVRADSEKLAIGNKATSIAGTSKVTNELTVAPDTK